MKIKQTILVLGMLTIAIGGLSISDPVSAKAGDPCGTTAILKEGENCCGGVVTSLISCDQKGDGYCPNNPEGLKYVTKDPTTKLLPLCADGSKPDAVAATGVWGILLLVINIMTAGIGILAVGGVVYGSVLYTTASDSAEQKKKGKVTIFNVVLGIVAYGLMYAFLNTIIPGGLFN